MKIYNTTQGIIVEHRNEFRLMPETDWDRFTNRSDLYQKISEELKELPHHPALTKAVQEGLLSPIGRQEVWACGITYMRTRQARMEDSKQGSAFYASVFEAERPEIFFK